MRCAIDHSLLEVVDGVIILHFVNELMDSTQTSRRYVAKALLSFISKGYIYGKGNYI